MWFFRGEDMIQENCIVSIILDFNLKPKEQNMSSLDSLSFADEKLDYWGE